MRHHKRRKLFFPFGLITLAVLPILGFQKIAQTYKSKTEMSHCIELNFPGSDTSFTDEKYSESRKYETFKLYTDRCRTI